MIQFVCDNCSAVKQPQEAWMVGQAAEAVGAVTARREVTIQSAWNRGTALHPFAVHFCSIECKDEYVSRLFSPGARVRTAALQEIVPAEVVVERVVPEHERVVTKARRSTRRKRAA